MATNKHENTTVQGGFVSLRDFCHDLLAPIRNRSKRLKRRRGDDAGMEIFEDTRIITVRDIIAGLWTAICDWVKRPFVREKPKVDRSQNVDGGTTLRHVGDLVTPEPTGNREQRRNNEYRGGRSPEEIHPYSRSKDFCMGSAAFRHAWGPNRHRPRRREPENH